VAITVTNLTEGADSSNNAAGGYNTAAVTLTAGRLYILQEGASDTVDPADPTSVTCGSATFTKLSTIGYNTNAAPLRRATVWGCIPGSTVSSTVLNIARTDDTGCHWSLQEVLGFDDSSLANAVPTGKIVTSFDADASGTSFAITMGALADASNAILMYQCYNQDATGTKDANYTLLGTQTSHYATPANAGLASYIIGNSDLTSTITWTGSVQHGGIGIEIAIAPTTSPTPPKMQVLRQAVKRSAVF
jgi:hypothetical protein